MLLQLKKVKSLDTTLVHHGYLGSASSPRCDLTGAGWNAAGAAALRDVVSGVEAIANGGCGARLAGWHWQAADGPRRGGGQRPFRAGVVVVNFTVWCVGGIFT